MLPSGLNRVTWTSGSPVRPVNTTVATTKPPLGRNVTVPLWDAVVMAAGARGAPGWPAGLNSRWLGRVNMSPFASRPSAVTPITEDSTGFELGTSSCPPEPKPLSMLPSELKRTRPPMSFRGLPPKRTAPPARILPSGCTRTVWAPWTFEFTNVVVARPPAPKPWSSVPLALNRTTANAAFVPLAAVASPAHTSLPSDWTARPGADGGDVPVRRPAPDPPAAAAAGRAGADGRGDPAGAGRL